MASQRLSTVIPTFSRLRKSPTSCGRSFATATVTNGQALKTIDLYDQCTGSLRKSYQASKSNQVEEAISQAAQCQPQWSQYTIDKRADLLQQVSQELQNRRDELIEIEVCDTARSISEVSAYDVSACVDCIEYYVSLVRDGVLDRQDVSLPGNGVGYTLRQPLGVTVGIGAWNFPLVNAIHKSIPSLLFGNTMIYKPSELTPTSALLLQDIYKQVGIPDGTFSVVLGDYQVGSQLVQHPLVSKISLTGSEQTGKVVSQQAAESATFKRLTLELGGKSPLIIMDDANVEEAIQGAMAGNWYASGQVCSNGTRVFVHESIHDEFVHGLIEQTQQLSIGDPMDGMTDVGPMISREQMEKVQKYVGIGVNVDGATLAYGGQPIDPMDPISNFSDVADSNGYFLSPAIFTNCTDDMRIVQEEVFGMLLSVLRFSTDDEVIHRANASKYGLAGGIFTQDVQRAQRVASQLHAGTVWINNYNLGHVQLPWSGWKQSGLGSENGIAGVEAWTQCKSVYVEMN